MAFVKSGWLLRQSTILKRWKKNWFDLWSDGHLIYYDDQTRQNVEDKIHMLVDCINIRMGNECRDFHPPEGKPKDCILQIVCRNGKTINLCAESEDDCLAWKFALQDARTNTAYVGSEVMCDETAVASSPPPYTAYATPSPEDLMDSNLPTMSSSGSVTGTTMETWLWACWLGQPLAWPWDLCSGSSKFLYIFVFVASKTFIYFLCAIIIYFARYPCFTVKIFNDNYNSTFKIVTS
ncbi:pleckstrin homology domain-containing family B member 2-like isoform X2 [Trichosurus vulpecula]|uniref:pleckstrin homology domain-containing family B member 2-like isoform X2 n=1 Tax=Trichosurus vulpecula TaxID=9337 RepID=UPI00186B4CDD|nr:pleckstrin homology domain-containing family B member 2-like isoform X2 [Trichosurus vulpecula]